jgi:phosphomevalonate kinase
VLTYISAVASPIIKPSSITILADNDYYTQAATDPASAAAAKKQHFISFGVSLQDAHKTGLGSSAALVTALTAALLVHYLPKDTIDLTSHQGRARLHNLAQTAHCAAQGKVGSGFDVASAVFGSCLYRRFSPSLLESHGNPGSSRFAQKLQAFVEESDPQHKWDTEIYKAKVKMPRGIRLIMCDVDCGSQTPGMVKQVLAWRKREPEEAEMLWTQLHCKNEALAAELTRLAEASGESADYKALKQCIIDIRVLIREMSRLSGVPIEPEPQTQLLDACSAIPGVTGGVVPGAGGFDAIALLVEDREEVIAKLGGLLKSWKLPATKLDAPGAAGSAICEPKASIGKVSMLNVREDMEGVRVEGDAAIYQGWAQQ